MKRDTAIRYQELIKGMESVLYGETNQLTVMSTLACLLKHEFEKYYWVGFYLEDQGVLKVGPYQGTLGCLTIEPGRGVCGRAYRTGKLQIVDDVHLDREHIACDAASQSEIVVPIKRHDGSIFGVLDVDSSQTAAFDETDGRYLQLIIERFIDPLI